ncbi:MAG: GntR family transcriptional regulator [Bacillota bacterium]
MEVARALRERLLAGGVQPSMRLPTQRELARQFGTTLMTVRQALALLAEEGLVKVHHGVGTFAADPGSFQDPIHLASFSEEMARQGVHIETQVIERTLLHDRPGIRDATHHASNAISEGVYRALAVPPGSAVFVISRLRRVGDVPVVYQRSYLPADLAEVGQAYEASVPLYAFLREQAGLVAARSEEVLQPCALPPAAAEVLAAPVSSPGLFSRRTSFDGHSRPFLYDEAYVRGDRVELHICRTGIREQSFYRILGWEVGRDERDRA